MKIEYKNKKKIITHPSGVVTIYDAAYMRRLKAIQEEGRDKAAQSIAEIDDSITKIGDS